MIGYVDESVHDRFGLYVVAAVLADPLHSGHAQRELSRLAPLPRGPHWHSEGAQVRSALVGAVNRLDVQARVYACRFPAPRKKEAARGRALRWMALDVDTRFLVLHTRQVDQNALDRRVLSRLAGRPARFAYEHVTADKEPMIWVADIVAGAAAYALIGRTSAYVDALDRVLTGVETEPERQGP